MPGDFQISVTEGLPDYWGDACTPPHMIRAFAAIVREIGTRQDEPQP